MDKIDLYREHKDEYVRPKSPVLVHVKAAKYLTILGEGAPDEEFHAAIGALYQMAYTIKMARKLAGGPDYKVCGLEALWWAPDGSPALDRVPPSSWRWKLLIRVPDFIRAVDRKAALAALAKKGKDAKAGSVVLEKIAEGRSVQVLHVGPYSAEQPSIERMRAFAAAQGLTARGAHHEIYISDPRRVPPERLKTILRQPVAKDQER